MLVLIGCSPSSGSSFLADLLDSIPGSLCGAELGLFSGKKFYDFSLFRTNPFSGSPASSIYWLKNGIYKHAITHYGVNADAIRRMARMTSKPGDFSEWLFDEFKKYRKKPEANIWFEKTPLNTNCIGRFLENYPGAKFIYLVRNPLHVYMSLLKRNYSNLIAATNWMIETANYYPYRDHPDVILLKYEDLVNDPFNVVSNLYYSLTKIRINTADLEENYKHNHYRESLGRQKTWNINQYGMVGDANKKDIPEAIIRKFDAFYNAGINGEYAELFSIGGISYRTAMQITGYDDAVSSLLPADGSTPEYSFRDRLRLSRKWAGDLGRGDASIRHIGAYLNPVM